MSAIDRLRDICDLATPGPWRLDGEGWVDEEPSAVLVYGGGAPMSLNEHCCALVSNYGQGEDECEATAAFIATFDPVRVRALLDIAQALAFYADEANWQHNMRTAPSGGDTLWTDAFFFDKGKKARDALAALSSLDREAHKP